MFELCVRNYYELHGSFQGIETMSYYQPLIKECKNQNIELNDYLYMLLGYKHDPVISASARYEFRKKFATGQIKELCDIFKCTKSELVNVLDKNNCLGEAYRAKTLDIPEMELDIPLFKMYSTDDYFSSMIKLYSYYLRNSKSNYVSDSKGNKIYFGELLMHIATRPSYADIKNFINSSVFQKAYSPATLTIRQTNVGHPVISKTTMFVPSKSGLTKHKTHIKELALYDALFGVMSMPISIRDRVKSILNKGYINYLSDKDLYLSLLDFSHMSGITLKELKSIVFLGSYDFNEQYSDFRGIAIPIDNISVAVYTATSGSDRLLLRDAQFKTLYEKGLLKTLVFKKGVANVYINKDVPIHNLFGLPSGNDMRGV